MKTNKNARTQKVEAAKTPKVSCTMTLNEKLNGVELKFSAKPSDGIREALKSAGFHWHSSKELWYAKQTEDALTVAKALSEGFVDGAQPKAVKSKKASTKSKVVAETKSEPKASKKPSKAKAEPKVQKPIAWSGTSKPKVSKKLMAALNKTEGLVAEMDRDWLWVSGDTRSYSESLKALGFRFSGRRQAWYLA